MTASASASTSTSTPRVPRFVGVFDPLAKRLLGAGVPLGPNALLTVRGRKSGLDRTTPVALVAIGGRRWLIGTFGETQWVRNLRAAGRASLAVRRNTEPVSVRELTSEQAAAFFRDELGPYVRRLLIGRWLLTRLGAAEILAEPSAAAKRHPVFEVRPA